jgi:4-alpha-glucanotransferase
MTSVTWLNSAYEAAKKNYDSAFAYFMDKISGFTIETIIMLLSGFIIGKLTLEYFKKLFAQYELIQTQEKAMKEKLGDLRVIAEDLGFLTPSVIKLVNRTGFPGMKILQFAFDSREESDYLPHNYPKNCIVYTGTHDNETARGWLDSILPEELCSVREYLAVETDDPEEIVDKLIRMGLSSVADLCIIPLQDYLYLDNRSRLNTPSTLGNNWKWRASESEINGALAKRIRKVTQLFGRLPVISSAEDEGEDSEEKDKEE